MADSTSSTGSTTGTQSTNTTYGSGNTTDRGTAIVKDGNTLGENSFLTILAAELSNQDPTQQTDSTQYVAQLAQFSSLQQMTNLNATNKFASANSLIGKGVMLNSTDANGNHYTGIVDGVTKNGSDVLLEVETTIDGKNQILEFDYDDVASTVDVPDTTPTAINQNVLLLTATSLVGKNAEFTVKDDKGTTDTADDTSTTYTGTIQNVFLSDGSVKFNVKLSDTGEVKQFDYSQITKVEGE